MRVSDGRTTVVWKGVREFDLDVDVVRHDAPLNQFDRKYARLDLISIPLAQVYPPTFSYTDVSPVCSPSLCLNAAGNAGLALCLPFCRAGELSRADRLSSRATAVRCGAACAYLGQQSLLQVRHHT